MNINKLIIKKKLKIFIICRLNSTRFKNKIKKKILNKSLLEILLLRLLSKFNRETIIICTSGKRNKFFSNLSNKYKVPLFYGSENNLFKRLIDCSKKYQVKHIIRITGDNPLTDLDVINKMIKIYFKKKLDYIYTNGLFPGLRPEIYSISSLKKMYKISEDPHSSEYLTYYYLRKKLNKIFCMKIKKKTIEDNLSITIDKKGDYLLLRNLIKSTKDIFINKNLLIRKLKKRKITKIKVVPLITEKYNVRLKTDSKNINFINLSEFNL